MPCINNKTLKDVTQLIETGWALKLIEAKKAWCQGEVMFTPSSYLVGSHANTRLKRIKFGVSDLMMQKVARDHIKMQHRYRAWESLWALGFVAHILLPD